MPERNLIILSAAVLLLTGCATSQLRVIKVATETPVQPTIMVGGVYPEPGGNTTVSKSVPYPENAEPAGRSAYPSPQVTTPAGQIPNPQPAVTQAPGAPQPWEQQPGDDKLQRGNVYIDSQKIVTEPGSPQNFILELKGNLPTPCNKLRVRLNMPDANQQLQVEVYSLVDPAEICIQVLQAFQVSVPLEGFPSGTYQVLVNQQPTGELTVP
jgi:hypothetical protein